MSHPLLEICVDSYASGLAAIQGGADRLEICSSLGSNGLTPSTGLLRVMKLACWKKKIPIICLIRPRDGGFDYSGVEFEQMLAEVRSLKMEGADGFKFGVLDSKGGIDLARCAQLIEAAQPCESVFHRAFDIVAKPLEAAQQIASLGFCRLLTSGQQTTAAQGSELIAQLVKDHENGGLTIMPGGGINEANIEFVVKTTNAKQFHTSASETVILRDDIPPGKDIGIKCTSQGKVEAIRAILNKFVM